MFYGYKESEWSCIIVCVLGEQRQWASCKIVCVLEYKDSERSCIIVCVLGDERQ